ncbi:hypothetical protein GCM10009734_19590 [Nonomuraea bangladeshensis]
MGACRGHRRRPLPLLRRWEEGAGKRHLVVDTFGLLMIVMVTAAGQPDCDAARELLVRLRMLHPQFTLVWATAPTPARWWSGPAVSYASP